MPQSNDILDRVHQNVHSIRPSNMAGDSNSNGRLIIYRLATILTYLLAVVTSVYYTFASPHDGKYHRRTIWGQNSAHHTPFALNSIIVSVYWIVLYTLSVGYIATLFTSPNTTAAQTKQAVLVAPHFIATNLLTFAFIHLWVRSLFGPALFIAIVQFFQITVGYFRFPNTANTVHVPVLAMPLAFAFVTLYWDGAAAAHARHVGARIVANVFIWSWPVYGGFYLVVFKDWALGFSLSALAAALGVAQFLTVAIGLQWIFAFTIMAVLFVASVTVAVPGIVGGDPFKRGKIVSQDQEREPLLGEAQA